MSEERQEMHWINATPDGGYVIRILESYIDDSYFSDNLMGLPPENPICIEMNKARETRNELLRKAIKILEGNFTKDVLLSECKKALESGLTAHRKLVSHCFNRNETWEEFEKRTHPTDAEVQMSLTLNKLTEAGVK